MTDNEDKEVDVKNEESVIEEIVDVPMTEGFHKAFGFVSTDNKKPLKDYEIEENHHDNVCYFNLYIFISSINHSCRMRSSIGWMFLK